MALFDYSRPVTAVDRVRYYTSHAIALLSAWNDQRRTRDTLSKLSNAQLDDLGLSRGDIDRVADSGRILK